MNKTIYDLAKMYGNGKGESTMWNSIRVISSAVEEHMPVEDRNTLKKEIYEMMAGEHFDEYFAKEAVAKMFYLDGDGERHDAPYWTDSAIKSVYDQVKSEIRSYNMWDFYVTLNMVAADNYGLLEMWFPGEDGPARDQHLVEMAVNWLRDPDAMHPDSKIWCYLNK